MKYFEILTHHYAWSNKEFEPLLLQVRHHILSVSLEYLHLTPEFSSGNIMLLTWTIMPHSQPNTSPSMKLRTKNDKERYQIGKRPPRLLLFWGMLIRIYVLIALWICTISMHTRTFVTNGVFFFCCSKMLSISESIDDMVAYTQLTDHVYHQILCSYAPELEEVICTPVSLQPFWRALR